MIGGGGGTVLMMGGGGGIVLIGGGWVAASAAANAMRLLIIWSIPLAATLPAILREAKCGERPSWPRAQFPS